MKTRKYLSIAGLAMALLSASGAATLLGLLFSGRLSSPTYELFLDRQEAILRAISLISICALLAISTAIFGLGQKRVIAVVISFVTLLPMTWLFFITSRF
jgi:ABC-type nitrate/sulfonate/bicarbonate transport system permease component